MSSLSVYTNECMRADIMQQLYMLYQLMQIIDPEDFTMHMTNKECTLYKFSSINSSVCHMHFWSQRNAGVL